MPVICPKCSHVRPPDATNPEWECPACGICYARYGSQLQAGTATRSARTPARAGSKSRGSWTMALLAGLGVCVAFVVLREDKTPAAPAPVVAEAPDAAETSSGAGRAVMDAALKASDADVSMLKDLSGRLEGKCAHNKYGLSEQECIDKLRARGDQCADRTARRYPGQLNDTGRVEVVMRDYVGCIFEE